MAVGTKWRIVLFVCAAISLREVKSSAEIMSKLTTGFQKVIETCKAEIAVGDDIIKDFYNFWREDYDLVHKEMGCMIICMASKLNLLTEDMKLHHGNAEEFAKSHGADDDMAKQLVSILHNCDGEQGAQSDPCIKALEVAKCFRRKIHELKWAPSMQVVLEEVMTEVKK